MKWLVDAKRGKKGVILETDIKYATQGKRSRFTPVASRTNVNHAVTNMKIMKQLKKPKRK